MILRSTVGDSRSLHRRALIGSLALVAMLALSGPAFAQAGGTGDIQSFVDNVKSWLTGTLAKSVAVIAVAVCGYRFFTGRASAGPLIAVLGGIALVFGANWVVGQFTGGAGS